MNTLLSEQQLVGLTRKLCSFRTYEPNGIVTARWFASRWLERGGVRVSSVRLPSGKLVVADIGRGPVEVLIAIHIDVVPPQRPRQRFPRRRGDRLVGRGVADMAAGAAAAMSVCRRRAQLVPDGLAVRLLISPDEETTMATFDEYIEHVGGASSELGRFAITPEPTGGLIGVRAKGRLLCRVATRGTSTHAAWAFRQSDPSAILEMIAALEWARALPFVGRSIGGFPEGVTVEPTWIGSPEGAANVTPERCEAILDIRHPASVSPKEILEHLRARFADVELIQELDPVEAPLDHPDVRRGIEIVERRVGGDATRSQRGTSLFSRLRVPGEEIVRIEWGPFGASYHGPDEWVGISSVVTYAHELDEFLDSCDRVRREPGRGPSTGRSGE